MLIMNLGGGGDMFKVKPNDVKGFLLTKGCWWDGLLGDRLATEDDFNKTHDMASVYLQVVTTKGTQSDLSK